MTVVVVVRLSKLVELGFFLVIIEISNLIEFGLSKRELRDGSWE